MLLTPTVGAQDVPPPPHSVFLSYFFLPDRLRAKQACLPLGDIQPKGEEISIPIGTHGSTIDFFRDFLSLEVAYKLMSAISTISLCSPPDFTLAKYRYSAWYLQDRVDSIMINLGVCHNWRPCLQSTHSVFSLEIWLPVL